MCGIVGGTSNRNILPILVEGLRRLEYRGYDSAGVAYKANGKISLVKNAGRVEELAEKLNLKKNNTVSIELYTTYIIFSIVVLIIIYYNIL